MPTKIHNSQLTDLSKQLRNNMTEEEKELWYKFLKPLNYHFCRQKIVGKYIVDFYCASKKIIIELDGSQHYIDDAVQKDIERDEYLNQLGFRVLRYSNLQIKTHFSDVCKDIYSHLCEE